MQFKQLDTLARNALGFPPNSPERAGAAIRHCLGRALRNGHCAVPQRKLVEAACDVLRLPDVGAGAFSSAEAAAAKEKEIRRSWRTGMFAVQPDGTQIVVMVMHPEDESFGDFGAGLVDERGLNVNSQCVSRTASPNPTHRRQYSTGHGYEFDASREVVVNADTDAEEASVETPVERPVTAAPPPTPAPEEEAEEITADVVVAVNLDGTR